MVVSQGGNYTKHIYMGSQRITSKVSNSGIFTTSPVNTTDLQAKLAQQTTIIKERFDSLGVKYSGVQQTGGLVSASPATTADSYFYHSDHLGSSSLITNKDGYLVQHIQYVPFGEVFVEERNASWSTPYKFNGKEQDEETGLCYYGARYYDPRTSVWLSVDPLAEMYPNIGSYVYCADNPVKYVDPDGRKFTNYRNVYFWGTFVTYNNFSAESGEAFHNTLQSMRGSNKLFSKVYSQLDSDLNNTYTFRAVDKSNASSKDLTNGQYNHSTKNIDLFFNNNVENYTDYSTIFEEVFHAGQSQFYGNNYPGSLTIEIEAKVAKAFSGTKTMGGFEVYFPNMKPFLKALVNGNVSNELWGEFKSALTVFRNDVSSTYINGKGNTAEANARYNTDTFHFVMPYLESLINRSLVPESGF